MNGKKERKTIGNGNSFADDLLECIVLVDSDSDFRYFSDFQFLCKMAPPLRGLPQLLHRKLNNNNHNIHSNQVQIYVVMRIRFRLAFLAC